VSTVARQYGAVLKQLVRDFEIGYHGDVHLSFKGQTAALQEKRLQNMITEIAQTAPDGKFSGGFRAPTEGYDATTEQLMLRLGLRYHAADPERSEARLPVMAKIGELAVKDDLVVLPRTQRDDINLLKQTTNVDELSKAMIADFEHAHESGAFSFFSVHTQNFAAASPLALSLPNLIAHMRKRSDKAWIATGADIANWWRERDRFRVDFSNSGKRLEFNVTVNGTAPFLGGAVVVVSPQRGVAPVVRPAKAGAPMPSIRKLDDFRFALVFESLTPGNFAYQATFN
jgi:peptidoglycan/xylan/chitin deacetylase (PgdA/CDA1 family)